MVFPVVMYGCQSWTTKKAEHQRIDAFEPWCWGRLLRVPWTARRYNQSFLKEISPEYSLEGLMQKLKPQTDIYVWASPVAQMVKNLPATWEIWVQSLGGKIAWRRKWQSTPVFLPGESPWTEAWQATVHGGQKELDMTEQLSTVNIHIYVHIDIYTHTHTYIFLK